MHGLLHRRDYVPVGSSGVHLRFRPAVNRNGGGSALFRYPRDLAGVHMFVVPAPAYLHGNGNVGGFHKLRDHFPEQHRILHQRTARSVSRDLRHGTAGIEIDNVRAEPLCDLHCPACKLRLAAEKLYRRGAFRICDRQQLRSLAVAVHKTLYTCHFGNGIRRAETLCSHSERSVRYPRHWCQRGSLFNFYVSYAYIFHYSFFFPAPYPGRALPCTQWGSAPCPARGQRCPLAPSGRSATRIALRAFLGKVATVSEYYLPDHCV